VLPLSLLSITATAQANSVLIKWQVSNESYVNYFSVERSGSSNKNFLEISKVYGKGNSLPMQSYATTDSRPQQGWNYYRLKQVDNDGKFKYSSVVPVFFDVNATIVLYPNPTTGFIYVSGLKEGEKADLFLRDMHGNKLSIANTTQSTYQFNLTNLSSGIYYLTILQAGRTVHRKFVLQQ
jgi:hypothetical protein